MDRRQRYKDDFKRELVKLVAEEGRRASEVADEHGVPRKRLYQWIADDRRARERMENPEVLELEKKLKAMNALIRDKDLEIELLKKAAAHFKHLDKS